MSYIHRDHIMTQLELVSKSQNFPFQFFNNTMFAPGLSSYTLSHNNVNNLTLKSQ